MYYFFHPGGISATVYRPFSELHNAIMCCDKPQVFIALEANHSYIKTTNRLNLPPTLKFIIQLSCLKACPAIPKFLKHTNSRDDSFLNNVELFGGGISNIYSNYCFAAAFALTNPTSLRTKFKLTPAQDCENEH